MMWCAVYTSAQRQTWLVSEHHVLKCVSSFILSSLVHRYSAIVTPVFECKSFFFLVHLRAKKYSNSILLNFKISLQFKLRIHYSDVKSINNIDIISTLHNAEKHRYACKKILNNFESYIFSSKSIQF